ncbi:(2Fe-2S)-binding protein [Emticicia sp. SJ17W-69]|uniref:(2Fe-2S)-binding protein n=1 Tax=Emticicia sp. SJ17W-69 TaxID=3421657 RepID=UPI003EB6CED3
MTRYEFLKSAGFSGGALMALLTSCVRESDKYVDALTVAPEATATGTATTGTTTTVTTGTATGTGTATNTGTATSNVVGVITTEELNKITSTKLKIDLTSTTYAKLKTVGGYVVVSGVVVALSKANTYVAATVTCSHEPKNRIIYSNNEWYCTDHGARFSLTGTGLNNNGRKGLAVYKVATDGKTLVVY